ncbi:MAG: hypothetical protein QXL15_04305 [Candidatus Korarchaeota archaeon]
MSEKKHGFDFSKTLEIAKAVGMTRHFWPIYQREMHGLVGHIDTSVGRTQICVLLPPEYPNVPPILEAPVRQKVLEAIVKESWKGDLVSFLKEIVKKFRTIPERDLLQWVVQNETKALQEKGYKIQQAGVLTIERIKEDKIAKITIDFRDYSKPPKITAEGVELPELESVKTWTDESSIQGVVDEIEKHLSSSGYTNIDRIIVDIKNPRIYFEAPLGTIIRVHGPLEKVSQFYAIMIGKNDAERKITIAGKVNPPLVISLSSLLNKLPHYKIDRAIHQYLLSVGKDVNISEIRELLNVAAVSRNSRISDLSEGEKRRVMIILGAMLNEYISLLSAPLRGIPTADMVRIERLIKYLSSTKMHTFLIYGDDIAAERYLVLDTDGSLLAYGTIGELMSEFKARPYAIRIRFSQITTLEQIKKIKGIKIIVPEIEGEIYKVFIHGNLRDVIENVLRIAIDEIYAIEQVPITINDYLLLREHIGRKKKD